MSLLMSLNCHPSTHINYFFPYTQIRCDFPLLFSILETIIFSTLPIIAACITTWFVCIEFPSCDLSICFSCTYFLYLLLIATPLRNEGEKDNAVYIINQETILLLYIIPLVFSPVLHLIVHHNVLEFNFNCLFGFLESFIFPLVLVCVAAERQLAYWTTETNEFLSNFVQNTKLFSSLLLCFFLQV